MGAPKPADGALASVEDIWTPVVDEKTGGTYYWNKLTNETTMVWIPKM